MNFQTFMLSTQCDYDEDNKITGRCCREKVKKISYCFFFFLLLFAQLVKELCLWWFEKREIFIISTDTHLKHITKFLFLNCCCCKILQNNLDFEKNISFGFRGLAGPHFLYVFSCVSRKFSFRKKCAKALYNFPNFKNGMNSFQSSRV
jgi:hypothetical protein